MVKISNDVDLFFLLDYLKDEGVIELNNSCSLRISLDNYRRVLNNQDDSVKVRKINNYIQMIINDFKKNNEHIDDIRDVVNRNCERLEIPEYMQKNVYSSVLEALLER